MDASLLESLTRVSDTLVKRPGAVSIDAVKKLASFYGFDTWLEKLDADLGLVSLTNTPNAMLSPLNPSLITSPLANVKPRQKSATLLASTEPEKSRLTLNLDRVVIDIDFEVPGTITNTGVSVGTDSDHNSLQFDFIKGWNGSLNAGEVLLHNLTRNKTLDEFNMNLRVLYMLDRLSKPSPNDIFSIFSCIVSSLNTENSFLGKSPNGYLGIGDLISNYNHKVGLFLKYWEDDRHVNRWLKENKPDLQCKPTEYFIHFKVRESQHDIKIHEKFIAPETKQSSSWFVDGQWQLPQSPDILETLSVIQMELFPRIWIPSDILDLLGFRYRVIDQSNQNWSDNTNNSKSASKLDDFYRNINATGDTMVGDYNIRSSLGCQIVELFKVQGLDLSKLNQLVKILRSWIKLSSILLKLIEKYGIKDSINDTHYTEDISLNDLLEINNSYANTKKWIDISFGDLKTGAIAIQTNSISFEIIDGVCSDPKTDISECLLTILGYQRMKIDPKLYDVLSEGSTSILFPKNNVFYNPVQQYNRDLSALAIKAFTNMYSKESLSKKRSKQPIGSMKIPHRDQIQFQSCETTQTANTEPFANILEALSASGLRAIRYSKEIPLAKKIVANDLSSAAVQSIQLNVDYNEANEKVQPQEANAITHMAITPNEYHVIDLDPYGTVAPFIDSAINSVKNGGLLLITCTDLGVLAGNGYPEKCFALYGGSNVWGDATHESALRLVLGLVARTAAKYGIAIEPVLSLSIDFYVRVFVRVWEKPIKVKELMSSNEVVIKCSGCYASVGQGLGKMNDASVKGNKFGLSKIEETCGPQCTYCGYTNHMCGPMWGGQLHEAEFIKNILELVDEEEGKEKSIYGTLKRVKGMLTMASNELCVNKEDYEEQRASQLYFATTTISRVLKIPAPSIDDYCSALGNLGFKASLTHAASNCIKTNAPWIIIWFIGCQFAKRANVDIERMSKTTAGYKILTNEKVQNAVDLQQVMKASEIEGYETKNEKEVVEWLFSRNPVSEAIKKLRKIKIVKFQENPTKNWGPKARPK